MKPARILIAGVAVTAGILAFLLSGKQQPAPPPVAVEPPKTAVKVEEPKFTEVLVAKVDIPIGSTLTSNEIQWVKWPQELATAVLIQRSTRPNAIEELKEFFTRQPFYAQEPIREEKLVKRFGSGFLAAVLPSGKRAMAISIDSRGASSAGGFISPGDFVDVISTVKNEDTKSNSEEDSYKSTTVLFNIRVLAIGQQVQEKNGERVVLGETATLELTPEQTEQVTLLQRKGTLALTLRSIADVHRVESAKKPQAEKASGALTVLRYGVSNEVNIR